MKHIIRLQSWFYSIPSCDRRTGEEVEREVGWAEGMGRREGLRRESERRGECVMARR